MAVPPVRPPLTVFSSKPQESQIQAILDSHFASVPRCLPIGCNIVVMQEGKTEYELTGGNIPPDVTQHWGSVSKQFTAACIVKLVQKGYLKFDDDIRILCPDLPEFKLDGVVQKVTVDHLLHMRSGLPEVWSLSLMSAQNAELLSNNAT